MLLLEVVLLILGSEIKNTNESIRHPIRINEKRPLKLRVKYIPFFIIITIRDYEILIFIITKYTLKQKINQQYEVRF